MTDHSISNIAAKWRHKHVEYLHRILLDPYPSLVERLETYINFAGPQFAALRGEVQQRLVHDINAIGIQCDRRDVFGDEFEVRDSFLSAHFPALAGRYLVPSHDERIETIELISESENQYFYEFRPRPVFSRRLHVKRRPAFQVHRAWGLRLLVSPGGFFLHNPKDRTYVVSAASVAYPLTVNNFSTMRVDKPIVLIQDVYEGGNFSHFLFDWATRFGLFCESGLERATDCLFVMGGIPQELQFRICNNLCDMYGVSEDCLLFPSEELHIVGSGPVYFFSDTKSQCVHPAVMGDDRAMDIIRRISGALKTPENSAKRIYISRSDTPLRQIKNESVIWNVLQEYDFDFVCLADLSLQDQIATMRGAEYIVAPHGMGLTHIAFHNGGASLLELHTPVNGTDAYAFISKAQGFAYDAIVGEDTGDPRQHFNISPRDLRERLRLPKSGWMKPLLHRNIIPDSRVFGRGWFGGVQAAKAVLSEDFAPFMTGNVIMKHVRDSKTDYPDHNVGYWVVPIKGKGAYTGSCWIYIPGEQPDIEVWLDADPLVDRHLVRAEVLAFNRWQRVEVTGRYRGEQPAIAFVLRVDGPAGSIILSTCWQVETLPFATPYVAT